MTFGRKPRRDLARPLRRITSQPRRASSGIYSCRSATTPASAPASTDRLETGAETVIENIGFPDPRGAEDHGLVAVGGDYRPEMLLTAYAHGIFPWPTEGFSHAWFSPNPRM
ncbi:MAG: hypothetical protein GY917_08560, partial [Planctomycetaceae bacterium]|nr:hypothetical protein [Planctomycetaceae bacterium]